VHTHLEGTSAPTSHPNAVNCRMQDALRSIREWACALTQTRTLELPARQRGMMKLRTYALSHNQIKITLSAQVLMMQCLVHLQRQLAITLRTEHAGAQMITSSSSPSTSTYECSQASTRTTSRHTMHYAHATAVERGELVTRHRVAAEHAARAAAVTGLLLPRRER
jgi:hypothetical protein